MFQKIITLFQPEKAWSVRRQVVIYLFLEMLLILFLVAVLGGGIGAMLMERHVQEQVREKIDLMEITGHEMIKTSHRILDMIGNQTNQRMWIFEQLDSYEGMMAEEILALSTRINNRWVGEDVRSALFQPYLRSEAALALMRATLHYEPLKEIVVTDSYGNLVSASGRTKEYYQGDKQWWQCAWNNNKGRSCLSDLEYDEATSDYVYSMSLPIRNKEEVVIGVIRGVFDADLMVRPISRIQFGKTGRALMVDGSGNVLQRSVEESGKLQPVIQKLPEQILEELHGSYGGYFHYRGKSPHQKLIGYRLLSTEFYTENPWYLVLMRERREYFGLFNTLAVLLLGIMAAFILGYFYVARFLGKHINQPLGELLNKMITLRGGDFKNALVDKEKIPDSDVGEIMVSYNKLVRTLDTTLLARGRLEEDYEKLTHTKDKFKKLSMIDELTGLYNRRGFTQLAELQLQRLSKSGTGILMFLADMDGLKGVNDQFGHAEGDRALKCIADALRASFRDSDVISRFAGDEFAILAIGASEEVASICKFRFEEQLEIIKEKAKLPYDLWVSMGATFCKVDDETEVSDLLEMADKKLYELKENRRWSS